MSELKSHKITMLGTGLIGMFYTMTLHNQRGADRVHIVYSRREERANAFAEEWNIPHATTDLAEAINHPETDTVVIGLPNNLHLKAVELAVEAGKGILCTKPLGRTAEEAKAMLDIVENAGVFGGYLEDLVYPPKTLKALESVQNGALGKILWVRSRETHPGPHSDWFWDLEQAGGGAIVDMGCHCIEIIRNFVGKNNKPLEVMCWADTLVHPIDAEDHGIALIRFESGAIGQFEVSWAFRGGMDLRDEVSGSEGTIWLNHWLRTGYEMFTAVGQSGYVAEKAERATPAGFSPSAMRSRNSAIGICSLICSTQLTKNENPLKLSTTAMSLTLSLMPAINPRNRNSGKSLKFRIGGARQKLPTRKQTGQMLMSDMLTSKMNGCRTAE